MPLWTRSGNLLTREGAVIDCPECPCPGRVDVPVPDGCCHPPPILKVKVSFRVRNIINLGFGTSPRGTFDVLPTDVLCDSGWFEGPIFDINVHEFGGGPTDMDWSMWWLGEAAVASLAWRMDLRCNTGIMGDPGDCYFDWSSGVSEPFGVSRHDFEAINSFAGGAGSGFCGAAIPKVVVGGVPFNNRFYYDDTPRAAPIAFSSVVLGCCSQWTSALTLCFPEIVRWTEGRVFNGTSWTNGTPAISDIGGRVGICPDPGSPGAPDFERGTGDFLIEIWEPEDEP